MPHQNLEIENGSRTPNRLRQHVWLDVSTFNKCLFTTKQGGFLLILICETSQIFVWRNKAFIFFQKSDIEFLHFGLIMHTMRQEGNCRVPRCHNVLDLYGRHVALDHECSKCGRVVQRRALRNHGWWPTGTWPQRLKRID